MNLDEILEAVAGLEENERETLERTLTGDTVKIGNKFEEYGTRLDNLNGLIETYQSNSETTNDKVSALETKVNELEETNAKLREDISVFMRNGLVPNISTPVENEPSKVALDAIFG